MYYLILDIIQCNLHTNTPYKIEIPRTHNYSFPIQNNIKFCSIALIPRVLLHTHTSNTTPNNTKNTHVYTLTKIHAYTKHYAKQYKTTHVYTHLKY